MQDARFDFGGEAVVLPPGAGGIGQGEDAAVPITALPARDESVGDAQRRADGGVAGPVGEHHDAPRTPRDPVRRGGRPKQLLEVRALDGREHEGHSRSKHAPRLSKSDAINISDVFH
jgi:hypothetical protein